MHCYQAVIINVKYGFWWFHRYRACYKYSIVNDDGRDICQLDTDASITEIVTILDAMSVPGTGGQIIIVQTPIEDDTLYPSDTVCFYVIGNK